MADAPFVEVYTGDLASEAQRAFAGAGFLETYSGNLATEAQRAFAGARFQELVPLFTPVPPTPPAPAVSNWSPAPQTAITINNTISFDVTDASGLFRRILVLVQFTGLEIYDTAFDGSTFGQRYLGPGNSKVAITNGFRFTLLREGGWPASPRIVPVAINQTGQENPVESETYAWTLVSRL